MLSNQHAYRAAHEDVSRRVSTCAQKNEWLSSARDAPRPRVREEILVGSMTATPGQYTLFLAMVIAGDSETFKWSPSFVYPNNRDGRYPARVEEERQGTESWSKYAGLTRLIDTGEIATRSGEQRALSLSLYPQPTRRIIGLRGRRRGAGKFRQKNKQRVNPSIRPRRRYDWCCYNYNKDTLTTTRSGAFSLSLFSNLV